VPIAVAKVLDHETKGQLTLEHYQRMKGDAEEFSTVREEDYGRFISEHGYREGEEDEEVTPEEIEGFKKYAGPLLKRMESEQPDFQRWKAMMREQVLAVVNEQYSVLDVVWQSIKPIDILFFALGISTAFGVVARAKPPGTLPTLHQE